MRAVILLAAALLAGACAPTRPSLPEMVPIGDNAIRAACDACFMKGRRQLVHAIDFRLPAGGATVIGVTSFDGDELSCVLSTVEGFTLFAARSGVPAGLAVQRAVPPFDAPGFAEGLLADVRLIFLALDLRQGRIGRSASNEKLCRYSGARGEVVDLVPVGEGCYRVQLYDAAGKLLRSLDARNCREAAGMRLPGELELVGHGASPYTLRMRLLDAQLF